MWSSIYKSNYDSYTRMFSTVFRVDVYHHSEGVDILHSHVLIAYLRLLTFVQVLCLLLCDDRASCEFVDGDLSCIDMF